MSNLLIVKASNGKTVSYWRTDQNYDMDLAAIATSKVEKYHPGETAVGYALCDAEQYRSLVDGETKNYDDDVTIVQKSAVTSETIVPPAGLTIQDLASDDNVVCVSA